MCCSNPQTEKTTVWGFTEEEIEHRWKVHQKFDPVNRLFGSSDDKEDDSARAPVPTVNSEAALASLESMLSQG